MRLEDLEAVMEIEEKCFILPWSKLSFLHELLDNERAYYYVAVRDQQILGYIGMWIVLDEGHITNLAVHPSYRRQGVGRALLKNLAFEGKKMGLNYLTLEVRISNLSAQILYKEVGFVEAGVRPGYYQDNREDALIMWKGPL
jgi:ribosomal-protein-alanine N-acetyltransferase